MTKKDYEKAVKIVNRLTQVCGTYEASIALDSFTELFLGDNPRFSRERFEEACQIPARKKVSA